MMDKIIDEDYKDLMMLEGRELDEEYPDCDDMKLICKGVKWCVQNNKAENKK